MHSRNGFKAILEAMTFFGAEGEESPDPEPEPAPPKPKEEPKASTSSDDRDAYIAELREEAKQNRLKAKKLADELEEYRRQELSDIEKAQEAATIAQRDLAAAETALRDSHVANAALQVAWELKFRDPGDAMHFLVLDDVDFDDEGRPSLASVKSQLKKVAEKKPYLLGAAGSGDGAPKSPPETEESDEDAFDARVKHYQEKFAAQGRPPKEALRR